MIITAVLQQYHYYSNTITTVVLLRYYSSTTAEATHRVITIIHTPMWREPSRSLSLSLPHGTEGPHDLSQKHPVIIIIHTPKRRMSAFMGGPPRALSKSVCYTTII